MLDLCYEEDSTAEVDANLVMTGAGDFIELQGTGEGGSFSYAELAQIIDLGWSGISEIHQKQREILALSEEERELFENADDPCEHKQGKIPRDEGAAGTAGYRASLRRRL